MSEPASPAGWAAILAAILLPVTVTVIGIWWSSQAHAARHAEELRLMQARVEAQALEISRLRREVTMLEADLDLVLDLD